MTCPPYGTLERYSNDPRDLSTMPYAYFIAQLTAILAAYVRQCLRPRGYLAVVIGNFREKDAEGKTGANVPVCGDLTRAMVNLGLELSEDVAYLTPLGTLPFRASNTYKKGRERWEAGRGRGPMLGKAHQRVLVFEKPA